MSQTIAAPKTLNEIPEKLIAAWQALGAELEELRCNQIMDAWERNQMPLILMNNSNVQKIARESVPVEQFPGWAEAIDRLLEDPAAQEKATFLLPALGAFIHAERLFQMPLLHPVIEKLSGNSGIHSAIPRNHAERERLAQILPTLDKALLQRRLLTVLVRNVSSERVDPTAAQRDALLKSLLAELPAGVWDFAEDSNYYGSSLAATLVEPLDNPELLGALMRRGSKALRQKVIRRCSELSMYQDFDWSQLLDVVEQYPEDFAAVQAYVDNLDCLQALWQKLDDAKSREYAVSNLWTLIENVFSADEEKHHQPSPKQCFDMLAQMLADDSKQVMATLTGENYGVNALTELPPQALESLWQRQLPALADLFLPAMAYRFAENPYYDTDHYEDDDDDDDDDDGDNKSDPEEVAYHEQQRSNSERLVQTILPAHREQIADIKPSELAAMLVFVNSESLLRELSDDIKPVAAKSKPVQKQLIVNFSQQNPNLLTELAWMDDKRKGIRTVALEALLQNNSADAGPLLRTFHDDKKTNDADKERILTKLEQLGTGTAGLTVTSELSADDLQEKAAKAKIKPQVEKLWSQELAESFVPLDENIGRWLLSLALETKEPTLPKIAVTALQNLSRENQARLVEHLVQLWLANNGDAKHRWLTLFIPGFGDDRIVDPLFDGFKAWQKRAKPKAVFVLETLGKIDTAYALSQVHEVYSKSMYSYAIDKGARDTLKAAAKRRKVELLDLFDELTPDFGLGPEGLVLDVGSFTYSVSVANDLSLRIRNDKTDKVTKSLPKAKADEDADKRASAESQFKFLRSSLKKVAKQQANRLKEALICARSWPQARWQTLFLDHPLLGILGQGFIWQRTDGKLQDSFRISEDHSLINAADEPVTLNETDLISLWHPVNADKADIDAWRTHLQDYEIKPLLDQVGLPCLQANEDEIKAGELKRFEGIEVEQFIAKRSLESWNYEVYDQDGSHIFGYTRYFPLLGLNVRITTDEMDAYSWEGATTTLGAFEFSRGNNKVPLSELPSSLIATVLGQGQALQAKQVEKSAA